MPTDFGPWTTAFSSDSQIGLSAFWKGRLVHLPAVSRLRSGSRDAHFRKMLAAILMIGALPLVQAGPQQQRRAADGAVANVFVAAIGDEEPRRELAAPDEAPPPGAAPIEAPASQLIALAVPALPNDEPTDQLRKALQAGSDYLSARQKSDGSFQTDGGIDTWRPGVTGLATLALIRTGAKPADLRIRQAAEFLRKQDLDDTYQTALQTLALCAIDPKRDLELIQGNVRKLEQSQIRKGPNRGSWSYGRNQPNLSGDFSNTEFALWALDAAAKAGAKVSPATWDAALRCWLGAQRQDGGWGYGSGAPASGSMTAAGIASVSICLEQLSTDERRPTEAERQAVKSGWNWMSQNYSANSNPGAVQWFLYYGVMLRRAADATGTKQLGDHDWREELTQRLIAHRHVDGYWRGVAGQENDPTLATSLALLILAGVDDEAANP